MTHTPTPALDTNYWVAFAEDIQLDGLRDTPLEAVVHVLLPVGFVEIGLTLWEQEWVDATVKVGVLSGQLPW